MLREQLVLQVHPDLKVLQVHRVRCATGATGSSGSDGASGARGVRGFRGERGPAGDNFNGDARLRTVEIGLERFDYELNRMSSDYRQGIAGLSAFRV